MQAWGEPKVSVSKKTDEKPLDIDDVIPNNYYPEKGYYQNAKTGAKTKFNNKMYLAKIGKLRKRSPRN